MQFEAEMAMTYEVYKKQYTYSLFNKAHIIRRFIIVILYLLLLIWAEMTTELHLFWLMQFIIVYLIIWMIRLIRAPQKQYQASRELLWGKYTYAFNEEEMHLYKKNDLSTSDLHLYYNGIFQVYESRDTFYIYINRMQAYPIPKTSLTAGTPEGLRELLQGKLGERYIIK